MYLPALYLVISYFEEDIQGNIRNKSNMNMTKEMTKEISAILLERSRILNSWNNVGIHESIFSVQHQGFKLKENRKWNKYIC